MKTRILLVMGALICAASLHADYSFNFAAAPQTDIGGTAYGDQLVFKDTLGSSVTATVTAYSTTGSGTSASTVGFTGTVSQASADEYTGNGVGICSVNDGSLSGCIATAPQHQVDNQYGTEYLVINFSQAIDLTNVVLKNFGTCSGCSVDMDMSYWTSTTSLSSLSSIPTTGWTSDNCSGSGCIASGLTDSLVVNGTGVKTLIIAAGTFSGNDSNFDYFKVSSLTGTTYSQIVGTPEPASFLLIGSGLLAGALFGRRRMNKKSDE